MSQTGFSFRVRLKLPIDSRISVEAPILNLACDDPGCTVTLSSYGKTDPIKSATILVLRGDMWPTADEAASIGGKYLDSVAMAFLRLGIGIDLGQRSPESRFTKHGLAWFEANTGGPILNDENGLMVFPYRPDVRFLKGGDANLILGRSEKLFKDAFGTALGKSIELSDRERLGLELFNASFFEASIDAKFLTLVMAVESLLVPAPRTEIARELVNDFIKQVKQAGALDEKEKASLLGSLRWLLDESISQTGRKLAKAKLGEKLYMGMPADKFFSHCYSLRSNLVHGNSARPTRSDVASAQVELKSFVADLLSSGVFGPPGT